MHESSVPASWPHVALRGSERLRRGHLEALLDGDLSGVTIDGVFSVEACSRTRASIEERAHGTGYAGNLGSVLTVPSHWPLKYEQHDDPTAWLSYFENVPSWHALRKQVLVPALGEDPLDVFVALLRSAWNGPVEPARHPLYGRELYAGIIRSGAPRLHFDYGSYDLGLSCDGQFGMTLILNALPCAVQRNYRVLGAAPGKYAPATPTGNYDLPRSMVAGAEMDEIPTPTGSLSLLSNRYLHEVLDCEGRLTFAIHVARLKDGRLVYFS